METNTYAQLLNLRGLAQVIDGAHSGDGDLIEQIERHNTRSARIAMRVRQLDVDRRSLADFSAWERIDAATLLAEHARLQREGWDLLLEIRNALQERESTLKQMEEGLFVRYQATEQEHDRAVQSAERRLASERRALQKTSPATAGSRFADLIADDESVDASATRLAVARSAFEDTAAARRNLAADVRVVVIRQREAFASMVH